jgi:hypothetical protein
MTEQARMQREEQDSAAWNRQRAAEARRKLVEAEQARQREQQLMAAEDEKSRLFNAAVRAAPIGDKLIFAGFDIVLFVSWQRREERKQRAEAELQRRRLELERRRRNAATRIQSRYLEST